MKHFWMMLLFLSTSLSALTDPPETEETESESADIEAVMVVTATRQERKLEDLPVSATVVDSQDLIERAATVAGEELLGVPGVFFRRQGAGSDDMMVNIRGLTGVHGNDTFLALLDGIPFISAHEEVLLAEIPIGAVDRVEVIHGPVSALYGRGALSGAVNYLTREPAGQQEISLDLQGGSFGYVRPHLSASIPAGDNHRLLVDAYFEQSDGWRNNTERESANILIKDEIVLSTRSRLTLYANYYQNTQGVGGQIPLGPDGTALDVAGGRRGFIGYESNEYDRDALLTALRYNVELRDGLDLETTLHYRKTQDNNVLNFYDPFGFDPDNNILRVNGFENDRDTSVLFVEPRLTWQTEKHNFIAGVNLERVKLKETDWWTGQNGFDFDTLAYYFYEINIDYSTGEILNRDHPFWVDRNETYRGDSTNDFSAIYLQDEWQLTDHTTLTLGLRYDVFKRDAQIDSDLDFDGVIDQSPAISDEEKHISPKASLHHRFNEVFSAYVSYGEGFNSNFGAVWQWDPGLYERGSDVPPSTVSNKEIGIKGRGESYSYSLSVYNMVQKDRLVFITNPNGFGPPKASTADEFESNGLELETSLKFSTDWQAHLSYAYIDAEWNAYTIDGVDYSGNQPTGVPEQMLSLGLRGQITDNLKLWGAFYQYDDYFVTLDNEVSGGGYQILDLGAGLALPGIGGQLTLVGKNLLNEEYYTLFGSSSPLNATPGLPAHFMLTLGFDF